MKSCLRFAFIASLFFCFTAGLLAVDGEIERSFPAQPGGRLLIDTDIGKIRVEGDSPEGVSMVVRYTGDDWERIREALEFDFDSRRNEVRVRLRLRRTSWFDGWFRHWRRGLEFDVRVPQQFDLDLKTSGGAIEVDHVRGEVEASTSGGGLRFGDIDGPVRGRTSGGSVELWRGTGTADLSTSGGSIKIGEVGGDVSARTSGGSIRIEQSRGNVEARTSGGGIRVEEVMGSIDASTSGGSIVARITRQPEGDCRLSTSGGSVEVYLNPDVQLELDAHSSGGRVTSQITPTRHYKTSKTVLEADLNGGGPRLVLRSSGGPIRIFAAR